MGYVYENIEILAAFQRTKNEHDNDEDVFGMTTITFQLSMMMLMINNNDNVLTKSSIVSF